MNDATFNLPTSYLMFNKYIPDEKTLQILFYFKRMFKTNKILKISHMYKKYDSISKFTKTKAIVQKSLLARIKKGLKNSL